jgi:hypothetical protein
MRGVPLYKRADWGKVRNELRAFRCEGDAEFILFARSSWAHNSIASLVDRASFWSCRMFRPRCIPSIFVVLLTLSGRSGFAAAEVDRLPVICTSCPSLSSVHSGSMMVADGSGGAYVCWVDADFRLRLTRLHPDLSVAAAWPTEGLVLAPELRGSHHIQPALADDGKGGVYVSWVEQDEGLELSLRLQRLRADGRPAAGWPSAGVLLSGPSSYIWYPTLVSIPGSGVAVAWTSVISRMAAVRLLRLDEQGQPVARWPAEGLVLGLSDGPLSDAVELGVDDSGGLYAAWAQFDWRAFDLMMSYVSPFGVASEGWTIAHRAVAAPATVLDRHPEIAVVGREAIVNWTDQSRETRPFVMALMDVLAQRISADGQMHWDSSIGNGHVIAAGPGNQQDAHLVGDGAGGAYFSWNERGPGAAEVGRLTHLQADGRPATGWPASGIALGSETSSLHSDLAGGALVTFFDGARAMLQRVARDWNPDIPATGVSLGTEIRENMKLCADGRGGAFLAWEDRKATSPAIRFDHIDAKPLSQPLPSAPLRAVQPSAPLPFVAYRVAPNPARAICRIEFDLPTRMPVDVEVFDVGGRRVARPAEGRMMEAGPGSVFWGLADRTGRRVPAGLYLVRVSAGRDHAVLRMAVIR